jgi:hypothetical protein
MVSEEMERVEKAQLVSTKWSLLSTKFNIINITSKIPTSTLHLKYLFMDGGGGLC